MNEALLTMHLVIKNWMVSHHRIPCSQ